MKKIYIVVAVLALLLGLNMVVHAESENLDLAGATTLQAQKCDFSQGPLIGEAWGECEQYIYEVANLAGGTDAQVALLSQQIVALLAQISDLNLGLTQ